MTRSLPLLVLFALLAGCEGTIGAPGASGDPSDRPPDDGAAPPGETPPPDPRDPLPEEPPYERPSFECVAGAPTTGAEPRLWRLTGAEYAAHVDAVFRMNEFAKVGPGKPPIEVPFTSTNPADRFRNYARSYTMSDEDFAIVVANAQALAQRWVELAQHEGVMRGRSFERACAEAEDLPACLRRVFEHVGHVLYRRPLQDDEQTRLLALYEDTVASDTHEAAVAAGLEHLFSAPQFLFRDEIARSDGRRRLDAHQVHAALALSLTGEPDARFQRGLDPAEALRPAFLRERILALLGEDLGENPRLLAFLREYTRYEQLDLVAKDMEEFRGYDPRALKSSMERWLRYLLRERGHEDLFTALLTDPSVFANERVAMQLAERDWGEELGRDFQRVELPETRRGLLTQPAWLVAKSHPEETHPVGRGHFIAESLLCQDIPPVPITVEAQLPDIPGATMRERLAEHSQETCWNCHQYMDDVGLAFETFDHLGRPRDTEHGRPIETAGAMRSEAIGEVPFEDTFGLIDQLVATPAARECFVLHNFQFWLGRRPTAGDACTLVEMYDDLAVEHDYVEMLVTLFTSDSFLTQTEPSE